MVGRKKRNGNGHATQNFDARLEALMTDLTALQKDVRGLARGAGAYAGEQANGAVHSVQEKIEDVQEKIEDVYEQVEEWANGNVGTLRDSVREQPLAACVLSMSAGALIGALLLRR